MPLTVLTYTTSFSLLTRPYSHVTATTTDHSTYPIYSTVGPSSSQPSSSLPSSCLSPPPPHHPPQPSPSLSPFPWKCPPHAHLTNPHPQRPQAWVKLHMAQTILQSTSRCTSVSSF